MQQRWILALSVFLGACSSTPRAQIVAHRAASGTAPENTLAAIDRAVDMGVDMVEVDLRSSADGVVVLFHDETLDRTTDGEGALASLPMAELEGLDAGSWFGAEFAGEPIPTLHQAFVRSANQTRFMLDLKVAGLGERIAIAAREARVEPSSLVVGAWDDEQLADVLAHLNGSTVLFIGKAPEDAGDAWLRGLIDKGYEALSLQWSSTTPELRAHVKALEMPLYVWTLNEPDELRAALDAGVTGIITDRPERLAPLLEPWPATGR